VGEQVFSAQKHFITRRDAKTLQGYLSAAFVDELENVTDGATALALVKNYGTHILLGGDWGGRFQMIMSAKKTLSSYSNSSNSSLSLEMEASYMGASVSGSYAETSESKQAGSFEENSTQATVVACGGGAYAASISGGDYAAWGNEVTANPTWCDYYATGKGEDPGLIPLYRLIADETKSELVKEAAQAYMLGWSLEPNEVLQVDTVSARFQHIGGAKIHRGNNKIAFDAASTRGGSFWRVAAKLSQDAVNKKINVALAYHAAEYNAVLVPDNDRNNNDSLVITATDKLSVPSSVSTNWGIYLGDEPKEYDSGWNFMEGAKIDEVDKAELGGSRFQSYPSSYTSMIDVMNGEQTITGTSTNGRLAIGWWHVSQNLPLALKMQEWEQAKESNGNLTNGIASFGALKTSPNWLPIWENPLFAINPTGVYSVFGNSVYSKAAESIGIFYEVKVPYIHIVKKQ
jgi:hypothetical protein